MRRSISAIVVTLAASTVSVASPLASATASGGRSAAPKPPGSFGIRLVDVPVSAADNPRALRYIVDYLPTGTVIHRRIRIMNHEPRTARFSVYPGAAHIARGLFAGYNGATRNELTGWISVQHPEVTLAAGKSVLDLITVRVPQGATRGEHYGVIWVQQTAQPRAASFGSFGVTEISRVGIRVYLAVGHGGAPPTRFDIASIAGHRSASGRPVIVAHVNNIGGRAVDLNGSVRLTNGPGHTSSAPFPAQRIVTLAPGHSWNVTFAVPKSLPNGSWRATVTLVSGLSVATGAATIQVAPIVAAQAGLSPMQWIWLVLGGMVLAAVLVMGQYALQHRRRHLPA